MTPTNDNIRQHLWRNYTAHIVEGGLYIGGMAFVAGDSVMPAMISSLGGPSWLIALTPMLTMLGFSWPPLLTAHRIEQLYWVKPFILTVGIFQRLPFLLAALSLFFLADSHPALVLLLVAMAPFISGTAGGFSYAAWLELVSKTIPANRRASAWALRFILSSTIGVLAGTVIEKTLDTHPGTTGYGILHLILLGFLVLSYVAFMTIRETIPQPKEQGQPRSLADNLRSLPSIVRDDRRFFRFMLSRLFMLGIFIMTPFMAIHALEVLEAPESFLGTLVTWQMIGIIVGNVIAGAIGDRCGGKLPMVIARVLASLLCVWVAVADAQWMFLGIFGLYGVGLAFDRVGTATLSIEIAPDVRRPTYMSLLAALAFIGMLCASAVSTIIRETFGTIAPAAWLAAGLTMASMVVTVGIGEPRGEGGVTGEQ